MKSQDRNAQLYRHFDANGALLYVGGAAKAIRLLGSGGLQRPFLPLRTARRTRLLVLERTSYRTVK
jgi:hypothetical protein